MSHPAEELFNSLGAYAEIERLIGEGEAEGLYLECKSPQSPKLNPGLQTQLAEAVSGFANTNGGVIIWGVSTVRHAHGNLDVLTQIEPIGNCQAFAKQVDKYVSLVTIPSVTAPPSQVLRADEDHTKGVVATYIPPTPGDPVQSNKDEYFYQRSGDEFRKMPYEILKRMFLGTHGPNLKPDFHKGLLTKTEDSCWVIPIVIENESSAVGKDVVVMLTLLNRQDIATANPSGRFDSVSDVNHGEWVYEAKLPYVIHRGLPTLVGPLVVRMKEGHNTLDLRIDVYANHMRAESWGFRIGDFMDGFSVELQAQRFLY